MGKILDENEYPELHKKRSNVDADTIMQKLSKDRVVKIA